MADGGMTTSLAVVYRVEPGTSCALDTVDVGAPFDVLAAIRIGRMWMEVVDTLTISVAVCNLSASETAVRGVRHESVRPQRSSLRLTFPVALDDDWKANDGDVLEVLATLKVCAGVHVAYGTARSGAFVAASTGETNWQDSSLVVERSSSARQ